LKLDDTLLSKDPELWTTKEKKVLSAFSARFF
jgi:hypothetical protein